MLLCQIHSFDALNNGGDTRLEGILSKQCRNSSLLEKSHRLGTEMCEIQRDPTALKKSRSKPRAAGKRGISRCRSEQARGKFGSRYKVNLLRRDSDCRLSYSRRIAALYVRHVEDQHGGLLPPWSIARVMFGHPVQLQSPESLYKQCPQRHVPI